MKQQLTNWLHRGGRSLKAGWKHARPHLWFVFLTVLLNTLCFLPQTIFSMEPGEALPWKLALEEDSPAWWITRDNPDWFRIWGELWVLGFLALVIRLKKPVWAVVSAVLIPLLVVFQVYYLASIQLYGQQPYLQNDLALAQEVVPLFLNQVLGQNWSLVISIGLAGLFGALLLGALSWDWAMSIRDLPRKRWVAGIWLILAIPVVWLTVAGSREESPQEAHSVRWISYSVRQSLSIPSGTVVEQLPEGIALYEQYFQEKLDEKPDVYWIFLESYGKVLADNPEMRPRYESFQDSLEQAWEAAGWHSISQYSNAPVKGGRSWLAFTSALAGFRLENHLVYNDLIENYYDYPVITRWFKEQGYTTTRIKTMNKQEASTPRNLLLAERFYGFDQWLQNDSFPYQGFQYDVFGGIPDQYALGYGYEHTRELSDKPLFLFMITMSGHQPWFPPAPILPDWHDLNNITEDPRNIPLDSAAKANLYLFYESRLRESSQERYHEAVEYQLGVVDQFIRTQADSNSIFVVIGDHQPPEHGNHWRYNFATPVHIICRDSSFLAKFGEARFEPGLFANPDGNTPIQHEGLYSLFLTRLLARYGRNNPTLDWIPDGLRLPEEE